jgi:hypothetical protein
MSKREVLEVTGNAFSVPVVGCVIAQILNALDMRQPNLHIMVPQLSIGMPSSAQPNPSHAIEDAIATLEQETQALLEDAARLRRQAEAIHINTHKNSGTPTAGHSVAKRQRVATSTQQLAAV